MAPKKTLLVGLIMLALGVQAQQPFIISADEISNTYDLSYAATVSNVGDKTLNLADIIANKVDVHFIPLKSIDGKTSFTTDNYWVKVGVKNQTDTRQLLYLETARPITDVVDLYIAHADSTVEELHSGDAQPFDKKPFKHRKTIFPVSLNGTEAITLYIHYKSDGEVLSLPLLAHKAGSLITETAENTLFFGLFYGILLLAAITYLFFYVGLRDRSFLYYGAYIIAVGLLQFSLDGLFFQYIMPGSGWLYLRSLMLFAVLSSFFSAKYVVSFLSLKQHFTLLPKTFNIIYILLAVVFVAPLTGSVGLQFSYPAANAIGLICLITIIISIIILYVRQQKIDAFFSIGISCLVIGFVIFILNNFGVLPNTFVTENSTKIGTGLEIIFLSLSMSNRIRKLRSEKEQMQAVALQRSEEMNEMKSYFMSNMSHELRTPLNAIMGIADVMVKEVKDEGIKNKFEVIKYASVSLLSSVNDILDFSKIEKGELKLDNEVFDPTKILEQIKNNFAHQASDKGLLFEYENDPALPEKIKGDALRLSQIVNNILSNAVKFTGHGTINFSIAHHKLPANKLNLIITVRDTGVGIPRTKLDTVFNSFSQERIDNKRKFGGLGLGLSIVKKLVDLHEGVITIESTVGAGTQCVITLPYHTVEEKPATKTPKTNDSFDLNGTKILVVEDNDVNQFIMNTILSRWKNTGFSIAGNGEEALAALQQSHYDIVLMDLQMPVMDGYEATECIRKGEAGQQYKEVPIIAVTADTTEETKFKVKQIGINEYMAKPIDQGMLYEKIVGLLNR